MKSKSRIAWVSLSIATGALVVACGGGGEGGFFPAGTASTPVAPEMPPAQPGACFTLPADGKAIAVTVASNIGVPASVGIATLTNEGPKAFEGQSYPTLKVHSPLAQLFDRETRHVLHMLPDAPFLPAGASTDDANGGRPAVRYAYTYADLTLEQLRTAIKDGKASVTTGLETLPPFDPATHEMQANVNKRLGTLSIPDLKPLHPTTADFAVGKPVTLLMLDRQALGTNPLPPLFQKFVKELTLTHAGREDVTVGDVKHPQACKLDIAIRRVEMYGYAMGYVEPKTDAATAWFGKEGLVKIELKGPGA